jgi:hypothetical protein
MPVGHTNKKGWERSTGERIKDDKGIKGIKKR